MNQTAEATYLVVSGFSRRWSNVDSSSKRSRGSTLQSKEIAAAIFGVQRAWHPVSEVVMQTLLGNIRYGLRQLRNAPTFTVVAVLTLALGVGANTAIFSVVQAVLLHPAGISQPERVVSLHTRYMQLNLPSIGASRTPSR